MTDYLLYASLIGALGLTGACADGGDTPSGAGGTPSSAGSAAAGAPGGAGTQAGFGGSTSAVDGATLVLNPNGTTPLAAELRVLFSGPASLEVSIEGEANWSVSGEGTDGLNLPLLGFKPAEEYRVTVTLTTDSESRVLAPLDLVTSPLPSGFPTIELVGSTPERMAPGHTVFSTPGEGSGYLVIVDQQGEVIWYHPLVGFGDVRELPNGNLLFLDGSSSDDGEEIVEMTFLGAEVHRFRSSSELSGQFGGFNHEVCPAPDGKLYSLEVSYDQIDAFRTDYADATLHGTVNVLDSVLVELDAEGNTLRKKALLDILDRERVAYDSLDPTPVADYQTDWVHLNAFVPVDGGSNFILSARNQDVVFKLSQDWSQIRWLLSNPTGWSEPFHPYLLTPVGVPAGEEFRWPYHQHAPELTPDGTVLLFDNGNYRATPGDGRTPMTDATSYSRAVEYRIDEEAMTVEEVWSYEYPDARLYSFAMGDANLQAASNTVLITYAMMAGVGDVLSEDLGWGWVQGRLVEVARDSGDEVVFDLSVHGMTPGAFGSPVYRAVRIPAIR